MKTHKFGIGDKVRLPDHAPYGGAQGTVMGLDVISDAPAYHVLVAKPNMKAKMVFWERELRLVSKATGEWDQEVI